MLASRAYFLLKAITGHFHAKMRRATSPFPRKRTAVQNISMCAVSFERLGLSFPSPVREKVAEGRERGTFFAPSRKPETNHEYLQYKPAL